MNQSKQRVTDILIDKIIILLINWWFDWFTSTRGVYLYLYLNFLSVMSHLCFLHYPLGSWLLVPSYVPSVFFNMTVGSLAWIGLGGTHFLTHITSVDSGHSSLADLDIQSDDCWVNDIRGCDSREFDCKGGVDKNKMGEWLIFSNNLHISCWSESIKTAGYWYFDW